MNPPRRGKAFADMTPAERAGWQIPSQGLQQTNPVRRVLASGTVDVANGAAFPVDAGLLQWSAPNGQAVECYLDISPVYLSAASPANYRPTWFGAEVGQGVGVATQRSALKVVYGAGGTLLNTVLCDVRTGFLPLPPVSFVQMSYVNVNSDGSAGAAIATKFSASLLEGACPQGDAPTYTFGALEDGTYEWPLQAKTVELIHPGRIAWGPFASPAGLIIQECTASPAVVSPPWSPVHVPFRDGALSFRYTNEPTAALKGLLVFTLDL